MIDRVGILIVAGGEATRLPGKLALPLGDRAGATVPMIVRVLHNMRVSDDARAPREIVVSCKGTFAPPIDASLDVPLVVDRWAGRGPLAGMISAMARMRSRYVFVAAADAPNLSAAFADELAARTEPGDEAVVPRHGPDERIEPLAAVYDRLAFVREGLPVLRSGRGAIVRVIDRLATRFVNIDDPESFANVNTPADYAALHPAPSEGIPSLSKLSKS